MTDMVHISRATYELTRPEIQKKRPRKQKHYDLAALQSEWIKRGVKCIDVIDDFLDIDPTVLEDTRDQVALQQQKASIAIRQLEKMLPGIKPQDALTADKDNKLEISWRK